MNVIKELLFLVNKININNVLKFKSLNNDNSALVILWYLKKKYSYGCYNLWEF